MVALEEVFDLIDAAHAKTKHGGRDILKYACKNFAGIPQEAFQMYLNLCEQCELKKARVKKGLVVKPILSEEMNSRSQLDLIDMQAQKYQGFKYVIAYQSKVGEDEAEMLSIKLRTGELVRLKKKVEPMVENELEEEEDDKSEAKMKVDEEDFSNLSASELLAKRRELLEEIRGKIASAAHALTINPYENVCIDRLGTK
uniref:Uncharacterized protein n=1 Tax=Acrobeloides nanus TaxID=290746 RepID=A0A914CUK3_9BILA